MAIFTTLNKQAITTVNGKRLYHKYFCAWAVFTLLHLLFPGVHAQTTAAPDTLKSNTTVAIPGKEYVRSPYHNFFWGKHYRKEWGTPVRAVNFFLDSVYGGLEPVKESGSRQTMGLRLKSKTGKEYVLRSVDKDFGKGLPEIYHGTFITRVAKDQVSFGYPLAAITITPMLEAAKIYHTNPIIVFLPEQNALGEFNGKYSNKLYLFEERPDDNQQDAPHFGYSENVIGTDKLFEKVFEDNDHRVNQRAFAKARLFDMFIGDWGRHADQWRWASFKENGTTIYKPIPRDRDQAYTRFDGLYPFLITNIAGAVHLESFGDKIRNIEFFNKPGYRLDLQFTNQLTEAEWITEATALQQALTDSLIENSMRLLPAELYAINGQKIAGHLKARRDLLQHFAHDYYTFLAREISVYGSDKRELFDITRGNNRETTIKIYKIKKDSTIHPVPFFSRTLTKKETKAVHLYGFKGDDLFRFSGNGHTGVKIRLLGVTRSDSVVSTHSPKDRKFQIYKGKSGLYDSTFQRRINISPIILVSPSVYKVFEQDALALFTRPGVHVGASMSFQPSPWKKDSLETIHHIAVNYGILRKTFYADYVGVFPRFAGKWDLLLKGKFDRPAAENFYGTGNETTDSAGADVNYYRVFSKRYFGGIGLSRNIRNRHFIDLTFFYQNIQANKNTGKYIAEKESGLPVFERHGYAGAEAGYHYSNTNNPVIATKGINFFAAGGYIQQTSGTRQSFFKTTSNIALYIPLGNVVSIAVRAGGSTIFGTANYYHLSRLGGNVNLRGFPRERFYGKSSFYNNNEIRFITNTRNFFFNGKIGVLGFYDQGRVWQPGEVSRKWHAGYGGGLIVSPFNKAALTATYGRSDEGYHLLLRASMFF